MRMYDIIMAKRLGQVLTDEQIRFAVEGFTRGCIPDYQMSALLMAICFQGMNEHETAYLTDCMARSGDMIDLSPIPGVKVDKHSTGGVGDKTSLVIGPIVASCGVPVAKMSGRGLGHTGGTLDKLESIPGLSVDIGKERFFEIVRDVGLSIIGQTGDVAPADKKLYALRDVTATVDNISLIASSIMSKKLAAGSDAILLDVKTGSGAFMKTLDDSVALAQAMVSIGEQMGRRTVALITDMDLPLGHAIGNALEVVEAVDTLRGHGPADFTEVCLQLASNMLLLAGKGELPACRAMAEDAVASGRAFAKFKAMAAAQGGDTSVLDDTAKFPRAPIVHEVKAPQSGYISHMDATRCGIASVALGAGRASKEDAIDHSAGILLHRKTGDRVERGEVLAELFTAREASVQEAEQMLLGAITFAQERPAPHNLVYARVTAAAVERF
ncbi:pyrimidine-nucleoside phosphorylase [Clostridiaceae bacterium NSJ-31]|uniref:Pyrimidine-nucleoside phosphorylase n=1 Tax=Ligaoa zhengdingensis TaxID=2763658 RepID=A0A926I5B2_9FIRM|nr:pyrimidine-nucleoside phosphorylase [Ligaoa zhengdingensis]MBC8547101.1 pyrimidine-nucleoside phosphorylase [Ligaoa zhengdingensis]